MDMTSVISAIIVGAIIGALARLVVPGRQSIGILVTIVLGIVGAFIGGFIATAFTTSQVVIFLLQVAVAAALVAIVGGTAKRGARI